MSQLLYDPFDDDDDKPRIYYWEVDDDGNIVAEETLAMSDEQKYLAAIAALQHRDIDVTLPALSAFMAISAIQLATRHPGFPANMRQYVVQVAQILICTLDPEGGDLAKLVMMGWDPANDVVVRKAN